MKLPMLVVTVVAALPANALAADQSAPVDKVDKRDSGSLSSGAKEASPATTKGENAPVGAEGSANEGHSSGMTGVDAEPKGPAEAGNNTPDGHGSPER